MSEDDKKGFWGSTLTRLKAALSKTKEAIVDPAIGDDEALHRALEGEDAPLPEPVSEETLAPESSEESSAILSSSLDEGAVALDTSSGDMAVSVATPEIVEQSTPEVQEFQGEPEKKPGWKGFFGIGKKKEEPDSAASPAAQATIPAVDVVAKTPVAAKNAAALSVIPIDEEYLEELEERLIKADLGLDNATTLVEHLRRESRGKNWTARDVVAFLKKEFTSILKSTPNPTLQFKEGKVNVYLIVGVNGTGKTTSVGKLSWRFKQEGKRVLLAAGDTFRAAAESQLEIWSDRAGVDIVRLDDGADPGAVVFKAMDRAIKENYDCLVIDTAGRLHNKSNLMAELKKIRGVVEKHGGGLPVECLLVLDASTGQNGLQQAKLFTEVCSLTGVILTKLDGTAKGGIVFSIARDLQIPVKLIGLGEQIDDLRDFEPELFVEALC